MTKKSEKNLEDKKKSIIFAPGNEKVVFEKCSAVPCKSFKPGEAMSVRDMLIRTERGQRLDVHTRFRAEGIPDNMYYREYEEVQLPDGSIEKRPKPDLKEDRFEQSPPDGIADIVDVMRYQEELNERREALRAKRKDKPSANADEPEPKSPPASKKEEKPSNADTNE